MAAVTSIGALVGQNIAGQVEPDPGFITLIPSIGSSLTLRLAGDPDQSAPVGGWASVDRDRLPAVRWWQAPTESTLTLDLALDVRLTGGPPMARRLQVLEEMGTAVDDRDEPPKIRLLGGNLPRALNRRWIMQGLQLGERVETAGVHVRQDLTVTLEQYVEADGLEPARTRATRTQAGRRRTRDVRSRAGDTIRAIAVRELGEAGLWRDIRHWNPRLKKTDPDAVLRTGTKVTLR